MFLLFCVQEELGVFEVAGVLISFLSRYLDSVQEADRRGSDSEPHLLFPRLEKNKLQRL